MTRRSSKTTQAAVLFFDSDCGLCQSSVQFFSKRDLKRRLSYAALQSPEGHEVLKSLGLPTQELQTLVFRKHSLLRTKSTAVLAALTELGGWWKIFARAAGIIPSSLRDQVYDIIARNRRSLSRLKKPCNVPNANKY